MTSSLARLLMPLLVAGFICRVSGAEVMVFAAASLTDSLKEIAADYQRQEQVKVTVNFGASSTLARQIEEGAPADIFFSADEAQMHRLETKGFIVEGSRRDRLSNSLVIIVASEHGASVESPRDLARPEIRHVALGDPRAVPIGVYAKSYLERAGLWQEVEPKVVPTENVRAALAAVEAGNAEAGIVYRTDALISTKVAIACVIPSNEAPEIRYPVALVNRSKNTAESNKFLQFLASKAATRVFQSRGFVVLQENGKPYR